MTDRAHLEFTLALHRLVAPDTTENVCWSPFSVASALGLLAHGARGETRAELVGLLGDLDQTSELLKAAGELAPTGRGEQEPVIAVSNTLWADETIEIERSFEEELSRWSNGSVRTTPFRTEPGKARDEINADVAATTRGLIPELLPADAIREDTVSTLVNALYLKCAWRNRFSEGATESLPFHTPSGPVSAQSMVLSERAGYAKVDGWQVISLPAVGGVEAVVLLPDLDLVDVEAGLTADSLADLLDAPVSQQLFLRLPKIRVGSRAELARALTALGVRTVFGDEADLSGISPSSLAVQDVLHEAVLELDEEGLEGAAATAVMMRLTSMPAEPVEITVDRPFLLVVRQVETGILYFVTRVTDPS